MSEGKKKVVSYVLRDMNEVDEALAEGYELYASPVVATVKDRRDNSDIVLISQPMVMYEEEKVETPNEKILSLLQAACELMSNESAAQERLEAALIHAARRGYATAALLEDHQKWDATRKFLVSTAVAQGWVK